MTGDDAALLDALGAAILGPVRYTRIETCERAGVPLAEATTLWRAMGFPVLPDDARAFTERDVAALRTAGDLRREGVVDADGLVGLTRTMAQAMSRLAASHAAIAAEHLTVVPGDEVAPLVASVAALMEFTWRRHLVAAAESVFVGMAGSEPETAVAVGFADLVGYTEASRSLPRDELAGLVETFEGVATEVVGGHGARVVKTLGDEVMYAVADVGVAVSVGLALAAAVAEALGRGVRVGVAYGPVLARLGDVYGPTVNIASRLTGLARPGSVLVDRGAAEALRDDARFDVAPIRRQAVRGYAHLAPFRVRAATGS